MGFKTSITLIKPRTSKESRDQSIRLAVSELYASSPHLSSKRKRELIRNTLKEYRPTKKKIR